jgi:2-methylcitrate dehydratase PrpD
MLADFIVDTRVLPQPAIDSAKMLILDTIGVALAAAVRPVGQIISRHVAVPDLSACATVLGCGTRTSHTMAALANGMLANALDFDEGSHLPTHILPAALAVAEFQNLPGKAVLDAFIVAYEASTRFTQAIDAGRRQGRGPTACGWWHVGLVGPIAAALAICRLLQFGRHETSTAIGLASCSSGGFRRNMGTMAKALHSGLAARAGIEAAEFARAGMSADPAIVESPLGFLSAVVRPEDRDETAITHRLGRPYVLEGPLRIKRYPACNPGHPLIDASLRLAHEHGVHPGEIDTIEADLRKFSLLRQAPHDTESAGFSGDFLIAVTLVYGRFTLDELTDEVVRDARVRSLMSKIRHRPADAPERILVTLTDGRTVSVEVPPVSRLSARDDICAKFRHCAVPVLPPPAIERLEDMILDLDHQPDVARLMMAAAPPASDTAPA